MLLISKCHCRIELVEGQYFTSLQGVESTPEVEINPRTPKDSDTSTKGWGAHDKHHTINGTWTEGETKLRINVLELTAIKFAIFSLLPLQVGKKHLRVSSTAISYTIGKGETVQCYATM